MKFTQATVDLLVAFKAKCEKILKESPAKAIKATFAIHQIQAAIAIVDLLLKYKDDLNKMIPLTPPRVEIDKFLSLMKVVDGNQSTWVPPINSDDSARFAQAYLEFLAGFIPLVKTNKYIEIGIFDKALLLGAEKFSGYKREALGPMFEQLHSNIAAELSAYQSIQTSHLLHTGSLESAPLYSLQLYAVSALEQQEYVPPTAATIQLKDGAAKVKVREVLATEQAAAQTQQLPKARFRDNFRKFYSQNAYDSLIADFRVLQIAFAAFVADYSNKPWKKALLVNIDAALLQSLNSILTATECETLFGATFTRTYTAIEYIKGSSLENTVNATAMRAKLEDLKLYAEQAEKIFQQKGDKVTTQLSEALVAATDFKTKVDTASKNPVHKNLSTLQPCLNKLRRYLKVLTFSSLLTTAYKTLQTNINDFTKKLAEEFDSVGKTGEELNKLKTAVTQLILKTTLVTEPLLMIDIAEHERTLAYPLLKPVLKAIKAYVESNVAEVGCKAIKELLDKNANFETRQDTTCENLFYWIRAMAQSSQSQQSAPPVLLAHPTHNNNVLQFYTLLGGTNFEYNALQQLQDFLKPSHTASLILNLGE